MIASGPTRAPASTTAPAQTVTPSPSCKPDTAPWAEEPGASRGRLPSTAWSSITQPAPIAVPACTTTYAPKLTSSAMRTPAPSSSPGARTSGDSPGARSPLAREASTSEAHYVRAGHLASHPAQVKDEARPLSDPRVVDPRMRRDDQ